MGFETIIARRERSSLVVTLNRPERRNAINFRMIEELIEATRQAGGEAAVRSLIITGGTGCFSAGADLKDLLAVESTTECAAYFRQLHRMNDTLEKLEKPVIAAIEGFCMTGGCEMALACDIRVAAEGASFAITSSRIGTVPGAGATQRLPRILGVGKALELMFSAEAINASEAHRIGLINRLVPAGEALKEALAIADCYQNRAPLSHAFIKRAVRQGVQMDLASALELEIFAATSVYGTEDRREGITAFLEKREAHFRGR
jgi:enoyl-CoA hydratase/carnithine racemase